MRNVLESYRPEDFSADIDIFLRDIALRRRIAEREGYTGFHAAERAWKLHLSTYYTMRETS